VVVESRVPTGAAEDSKGAEGVCVRISLFHCPGRKAERKELEEQHHWTAALQASPLSSEAAWQGLRGYLTIGGTDTMQPSTEASFTAAKQKLPLASGGGLARCI